MNQTLHSTIHDIYDAALHPEMWPQTLREIADLMNAGPAELTLMDPDKSFPDLTVDCRLPPNIRENYFKNIYTTDKRIPRLLALPDQGGIATERLLTDDEWKQSGELRHFLESNEIGNLVASNVRTKGLVTWLGVGRKGYNNPFSAQELALYNEILKHIVRAAHIHLTIQELKLRIEDLAGLLSLENKAVIFLDQTNRVIFSNEQTHILARNKTISLCNNRLHLKDRNADSRLNAALHALANDGHINGHFQDVMIFQNKEGGEFGLRLLPSMRDILEKDLNSPHQTMVIITDLDSMKKPERAEIDRFATLFALTPAETDVIECVASMKSLSDYAKKRNISLDTPRKQLKAAMNKIGVNSQKQLLRRLDRFCFIQMR